jgi:holliday junction DNA helicase RuvA
MIASLRGTLLERSPVSCVIEVGGVGYRLQVSSHTASALPAPGAPVFLRTRQIVREDTVALFGFADADELALFDLLIGVSGVGPRLALAVLSGLRPQAVCKAIRDQQVAVLTGIPGIGRRTAERLVVELRDRLDAIGDSSSEGGVLPRADLWKDAVAALTALGYTAAQAQDALRRIAGTDDPEPSLETLVRRALAHLTRPATGKERR